MIKFNKVTIGNYTSCVISDEEWMDSYGVVHTPNRGIFNDHEPIMNYLINRFGYIDMYIIVKGEMISLVNQPSIIKGLFREEKIDKLLRRRQ